MNKTGQFATVKDNQLHINLILDDNRLVEHFGAMELAGNDLSVVIPNYLTLYTKIIDDASPRATELSVAQSVGSLRSKIDSSIGTLGESVGTAVNAIEELLQKNLGEHGETTKAIENFRRDLLEYIDNDGSALHRLIGTKVSESVRKAMESNQLTVESISQAVESASEPKRAAQHKEILEIVHRIESEVSAGKKIAELIAETPKKGQPYEDLVFEYLAPVAASASDLVEDTSKVMGNLNRPAGDFVVTHTIDGSPKFNVVFEAKAGAMSKADWLREADTAMPNRDATVFVGLAKLESAVPGKCGFTLLRDDVIVMHFDPESNPSDEVILSVAYRYALSLGRRGLDRSSTRFHDAAKELRVLIGELKSQHALAKKVEANGKELRTFVEHLSAKLPEVLRLVEDGGDA